MRFWLPQPKDADFATFVLIPWLIPTEPYEVMAKMLRTRLRRKTMFCSIAIEDNLIHAVLIAFIEPMEHVVWIWQARCRQGFRYSKLMFEHLCLWAKGKGMKRLGLGAFNDRYRKLYERRYGFVGDGLEMYKCI